MGKVFIGFAMSDSMFPDECDCDRDKLSEEQVKQVMSSADEVVNACNRGHVPTLEILKGRHGIDLTKGIQEKPPKIKLAFQDQLIVCDVNLPRLEGRHEYTKEEIEGAKFRFGIWTVNTVGQPS